MSAARVLVIGEGPHELGHRPADCASRDWPLSAHRLPALPLLVHRVLGEPEGVAFFAKEIGVPRRHVQSNLRRGTPTQLGGHGKQLFWALRDAGGKYQAVAYVMDRDRQADRAVIDDLRAARDKFAAEQDLPCAVGAAVETFDAWMIADPEAIESAGGDKSRWHPAPEGLDGTEASGNHPKCYAAAIFGGASGLAERYARAAAAMRVDRLEQSCPQGFAPFAREVRERIGPAVDRTS